MEFGRIDTDQEELIIEHRQIALRLATKILRAWQIKLQSDELESVANLALCEAAARFRKEKGVRFTTFLYHHMRGGLLRTIESTIGQKKAVQMAAMYEAVRRGEQLSEGPLWRDSLGESEEMEFEDGIDPDALFRDSFISPEEFLLRSERVTAVNEAIKSLPVLEQEYAAMIMQGGGLEKRRRAIGRSKVLDKLKAILLRSDIF